MHSLSEENYLKAIYKLLETGRKRVGTNEIGNMLETKASSVTDMLKKLQKKGLVDYTPYYGVKLTENGRSKAIEVIRKHRLWETFLFRKLQIPVELIHDIAEQLEHVQSEILTEALEKYLNYPQTDPHGRNIPQKEES